MDGVIKVIDMLGLTISDLQRQLAEAQTTIQNQQAEIAKLKEPTEKPPERGTPG